MGGSEEKTEKGLVARIVELVRRKAAKMGASALVAYLMIDAVVYAFALTAAREAFLRTTGKEPWADVRGFLLVVGGIWAGNNATRPLRMAGAAALSPVVGRILASVEGLLPAGVRNKALPGGATLATPLAAAVLLGAWGILVLALLVCIAMARG
eukprot:TRINITY_DN5769_c0_g1_i1.p3 TRINITY_DN5769_c0_g1~~TRINITY_DN5769_c0_g1_i1.p3  ORF type:complete len:154 (+),score=39.17 TRINITY_DN5769_c0_g1_i1:81-542(+)